MTVSGHTQPRPDTINTTPNSRPSVNLETTRPGNEARLLLALQVKDYM